MQLHIEMLISLDKIFDNNLMKKKCNILVKRQLQITVVLNSFFFFDAYGLIGSRLHNVTQIENFAISTPHTQSFNFAEPISDGLVCGSKCTNLTCEKRGFNSVQLLMLSKNTFPATDLRYLMFESQSDVIVMEIMFSKGSLGDREENMSLPFEEYMKYVLSLISFGVEGSENDLVT